MDPNSSSQNNAIINDQDSFVKPPNTYADSSQVLQTQDIQQSFANEWEPSSPVSTYSKFLTFAGEIFGACGLVPCCCCSNPYKSIEQGNVGLITRFGQLYKIVDPGLTKVNIISEDLISLSVKIQYIEVPSQKCITKDNVTVLITSVVYYNINQPHRAAFAITNLNSALNERAQTTLRQVVGGKNLQEIIEKRELVAIDMENLISQTAKEWGVHIESILIKDLSLPENVSNSLSLAAEAKRIGEGKIIAAKAEVESAKLMRKAADILASKPAMQIRYLDAMQNMAKSANSKVIFMPGASSSSTIEEADDFSNPKNKKQTMYPTHPIISPLPTGQDDDLFDNELQIVRMTALNEGISH
ncbi:slipin family protein ASCRUDRAFT_74949 [Ascoidea rubescens DSM 1968]|uniref:Band 7 domain-containing protein n=1 Tax=Ascoidea rubescens DSM 1968 TaxID=1344418 RepID=A0A1D2VLW1_9ASCO|nr:hypothetical protein ASCRUDRAFT_74949 [Ascoidea rubescens DSM 1968]ODV62598.1 hypothetical protein ASCRUDRAFT_74949 [Ascoidea rubescens DSM 1968]